MAQPTTHADYRIGLLLREGGWTVEEMLECVDEMTIDNLLGFIPQLLSRYAAVVTIGSAGGERTFICRLNRYRYL